MQPFYYIFGIEISWYGTCIVVGFLLALLIFYFLSKKFLKFLDFFLFSLFIAMGAFIGAKILAIIVALPIFIPLNVPWYLYFTNSGFVFYGGVIGAFLMGSWFIKLFGLNPAKIWDAVVVCLPLAQCIGRIGCFMAGCCYGKETDSIFGVVFANSLDSSYSYAKVLPTQLFESVACLFIFIILLILYKKKYKTYRLVFWYAVLYGVFRFFNEFLRGDINRGVAILSTSQYLSLILIVFGSLIYFTNLKNTKLFSQSTPLSRAYRKKLENENK